MSLLRRGAICLLAIASIFVGDPATGAPVDSCKQEGPHRAADFSSHEKGLNFFWSQCPKTISVCEDPTFANCFLKDDPSTLKEVHDAVKAQKGENLPLESENDNRYRMTLAGQSECKEGSTQNRAVSLNFTCKLDLLELEWPLVLDVSLNCGFPSNSSSNSLALHTKGKSSRSRRSLQGPLMAIWNEKMAFVGKMLENGNNQKMLKQLSDDLKNMNFHLKALEDAVREQGILASLYWHKSSIDGGLNQLRNHIRYPENSIMRDKFKNWSPTVLDSMEAIFSILVDDRLQPSFLEVLRDTAECRVESIEMRTNNILGLIWIGAYVYSASFTFFPADDRNDLWEQFGAVLSDRSSDVCSKFRELELDCNNRTTEATVDPIMEETSNIFTLNIVQFVSAVVFNLFFLSLYLCRRIRKARKKTEKVSASWVSFQASNDN